MGISTLEPAILDGSLHSDKLLNTSYTSSVASFQVINDFILVPLVYFSGRT